MISQLASLSAELISNQANVGLQSNSMDGQFAAVNVSFTFAQGHYSKRQLLEKAKRLVDEASAFLKGEIEKSP